MSSVNTPPDCPSHPQHYSMAMDDQDPTGPRSAMWWIPTATSSTEISNLVCHGDLLQDSRFKAAPHNVKPERASPTLCCLTLLASSAVWPVYTAIISVRGAVRSITLAWTNQASGSTAVRVIDHSCVHFFKVFLTLGVSTHATTSISITMVSTFSSFMHTHPHVPTVRHSFSKLLAQHPSKGSRSKEIY